MNHGVAILIPAAGASSRMRGEDKLLRPVHGVSLLQRSVRTALAASPDVIVALPALTHPRAALLSDLPAQMIAVPDWQTGMSASIRHGVAAQPETCRAVMILPADMPDLRVGDLQQMIASYLDLPTNAILRASDADGTPGHPVVFGAKYFTELQTITGDQGARSVLQTHKTHVAMFPLQGQRATTDLDTPEAWRDWETRNRP